MPIDNGKEDGAKVVQFPAWAMHPDDSGKNTKASGGNWSEVSKGEGAKPNNKLLSLASPSLSSRFDMLEGDESSACSEVMKPSSRCEGVGCFGQDDQNYEDCAENFYIGGND